MTAETAFDALEIVCIGLFVAGVLCVGAVIEANMPRNLIRDAMYRFTRWRLDRHDDPAIRALADQAAGQMAHTAARASSPTRCGPRRIERLREQFEGGMSATAGILILGFLFCAFLTWEMRRADPRGRAARGRTHGS